MSERSSPLLFHIPYILVATDQYMNDISDSDHEAMWGSSSGSGSEPPSPNRALDNMIRRPSHLIMPVLDSPFSYGEVTTPSSLSQQDGPSLPDSPLTSADVKSVHLDPDDHPDDEEPTILDASEDNGNEADDAVLGEAESTCGYMHRRVADMTYRLVHTVANSAKDLFRRFFRLPYLILVVITAVIWHNVSSVSADAHPHMLTFF